MFHDHENPVEPEFIPTGVEQRYNGTYGTGRTNPPKRHGCCLVWVLLAAVLVGSTVAVFSRLSERADTKTKGPGLTADTLDATDSSAEGLQAVEQPHEPTQASPEKGGDTEKLTISQSPEAVPNVPQAGGLSLQEIYSKVSPSAVSITAVSHRGTAYGSGIIMTDSGYIITNCHVVDEGLSLTVTLYDGRACEAVLVGKDATSDLAVLQIFAQGLTPAEFGNSDQVRVGDAAVAIGDPLGLELRGTMTEGIISAINRDLTIEGKHMTLLQTTAALNEGNSGGPLINCYGQVIGINTAKIGSYYNGGVEALGFAIPINTAKEIIDQLIAVGYVPGRPSLGVETTVLDSQYRFFYDLPQGLYITEVPEDSHAWQIGLRRGDTITSVAGVDVSDQEDLNAVLSGYEAGDTVTITIYRSHRMYQGELILQESGG